VTERQPGNGADEASEAASVTGNIEDKLGHDDSTRVAPLSVQQGNDDLTRVATPTGGETSGHPQPEGAPTEGFATAHGLLNSTTAERRVLKDRFILDDVIGEGGMGSVYRARDLRKVEAEDKNPFVAIKILSENLGSDVDALTTLQQEAVKTQALAHPNILTVYDFDRDGATFFMTMELLKGDPLDQLLELEAPFSHALALRYTRDLCAGLEYAHQRGLVHADFKPGNVFVTTSGTAKILDFGIAQAITKPLGGSRFAANKLNALTPAYATCEMMNGEKPSEADDVYALACVLYFMLTGSHPYGMKSAETAALEALQPLQPETLSDRQWRPFADALSPDKDRRPKSVGEFRDHVLSPLSEETSAVSPRTADSSLVKPGVAVGAAALVLIGVLLVNSFGDKSTSSGEQPDPPLVATGSSDLPASSPEANPLPAEPDPNKTKGLIRMAKNCYEEQNFGCAREHYQQLMIHLGGDHVKVIRLDQTISSAENQAVDDWLQEGEQCRESGDFACMESNANDVLEIKKNNQQALVLLEDAKTMARKAKAEKFIVN